MDDKNYTPEKNLDDYGGAKPKHSFWKFFAVFLFIIFLAVFGYGAFRWHQLRQNEKKIEEAANRLKQTEEELYQRQLADTYGGKTPQETLQMYIDAVEKGDYELASRYFIEENREKELNSFHGATNEFIKNYLNLVKQTISKEGNYDLEKKYFSLYKPILIRVILYPNGIWKIIEI